MSETPELNDGEEKSPDTDQSSIDWLEQLAGEPDAIWGSAAAESELPEAQDAGEVVPEADVPAQSGYEASARQAAAEKRALIASRLEPTVESPNPTQEQVRSLVRALEKDEESNAKVDWPAQEAGDEIEQAGEAHGTVSSGAAYAARVEPVTDEAPVAVQSGQAEQEIVDYGEEQILEIDDLMWLDDMEKMPEMKRNLHDDDAGLPANESANSAPGDSESEGLDDAVPTALFDANLDQVPDDPDEAIAWLERLAARQGAPAEELPTVQSATPAAHIESAAGPGESGVSEMDAGEIPEDPDEAMAWLEMLAAKEVANVGGESAPQPAAEPEAEAIAVADTTAEGEPTPEVLSADLDEALEGTLPSGLDEALDWLEELTIEPVTDEPAAEPAEPMPVVEEPPTPAVAHHVDEALAGAELLFAEPGPGEPAADVEQPVDELQYDEADDAMAWLEQLAARQGAPIEELTTIDAEPDDLAPETGVTAEPAVEDSGPVDVAPVDVAAAIGETEAGEEMVPEAEETPVAAVDEPVAVPEGLVEEAVVETDEAAEVTVVEHVQVEQDLAELAAVEEEELEIAVEPEAPEGDLAWLETLGAVDAQKWLEAEAADQEEEPAAASEPAADEAQPGTVEVSPGEVGLLFGTSPDVPGSEALADARRDMQEGNIDESLIQYAALVEQGQFLPFLIDDLEAVSDQRGPEPGVQRVLGDAYARNGQLRKALESYREALANL